MTLRAIELGVGRVRDLYAAPVTLERFQNIDPVTVRNDSLYFWSDFDESVGGELYRLPVPSARGVDTSSSATAAIARGAYALAVSHETARVAHDVSLPVELIVSDAAGRVVGRASGLTNTDISLPRLPGAIGFVTAWVDGQRVTARHLAAQP